MTRIDHIEDLQQNRAQLISALYTARWRGTFFATLSGILACVCVWLIWVVRG